METRITDEAHAMEALGRDFLSKSGWLISYMTRRAVDADEKPLPWWSYPFIEFLKTKIKKDMRVFEFGCGYSTLWLASKTSEVHSVESDRLWFERMIPVIPENVTLLHREGDDFAGELLKYTGFDIIVIDGADRVNCAKIAPRALKEDGVIIFDNFGTRWAEGFRYLEALGFRRIIFDGLAPICTYAVRTAILYRTNNCFNI